MHNLQMREVRLVGSTQLLLYYLFFSPRMGVCFKEGGLARGKKKTVTFKSHQSCKQCSVLFSC